MYVYILNGKLFGKDIYEINVTDDLKKRLESDVVGYPNDNKILFTEKIKFYDPIKFKKLLKLYMEDYEINNNYYKINFEKAKNIILKNLKVYDVEPKPEPIQIRKGCLGFSY